MFLGRWDPFFDMSKTLEEVDRMFDAANRPLGLRSVPRGTSPAINIYDRGESAVLGAEIPGVDPNELELTVLNDTVTIIGKRPFEANDEDRVYRRERWSGEFSRTLTLPDAVDPDKAHAEYKNGVLRVSLEKAEKAKAKRIQIKS